MADAGLFVGFGLPVRGREEQAVDIFGEAMTYYTGLREQGEIEDFDVVLLESHGGDLGGFFLLQGESEKLAALRATEDFRRLSIRASLIVENFGVVGAVVGDGIGDQMALYQAQIADLVPTA
jgi:hypothetical protein